MARMTSRCPDVSDRDLCSKVARSSALRTICTLGFGLGIVRPHPKLDRRAKKAARFLPWPCTQHLAARLVARLGRRRPLVRTRGLRLLFDEVREVGREGRDERGEPGEQRLAAHAADDG